MERFIIKKLLVWKERKRRMPILLDGARQVGKTYLLKELFGKVYFQRYIILDFLEHPECSKIFSGPKSVESIVKNIQIFLNIDFNIDEDLLILDEVGECQDAVTSLKYFSEQAPYAFVCASGSNIGLLNSFPVGRVTQLKLRPMHFEEFVFANGNPFLAKVFKNRERTDVIHDQLWQLLLEYYFVGGMPQAVKAWTSGNKSKMNTLVANVREIQEGIIKGYIRDFGKFSKSKSAAMHIEAVFQNIPIQLSKDIEGSVKRYQFSNVLSKKNGYQDLQGPIEFLVKCGLISKNYPIEGRVKSPLKSLISTSQFKLFVHDIGLLHCMLEMSFVEIMNQNFDFKGYIAENFVQNEIVSLGQEHTYSWRSGRQAEVEFLFKSEEGDIIPIEVKSGKRTKAKSLGEYIEKFVPKLAYKFSANIGGFRSTVLKTLPLYYVRSYIDVLTKVK